MDANPPPRPDAVWPDGFRERAQAIADRHARRDPEREAAKAGAIAALRAVCETLALLGVDASVVHHIAENGEVMADGIADDYVQARASERRAPVQGEMSYRLLAGVPTGAPCRPDSRREGWESL